ncbi:TIGR03086 family metal-binding protein [Nocardioides perillae]|uniref:Uncharacterized protein (TIGR03086 family) n=1 Tax=Nocardioides perillae TaxID=1119534 RepID=A0A7Y9UUW5_9ACTN|nr:uncharacterized protein (TIGR03086 family) [Nocardioides perillae]
MPPSPTGVPDPVELLERALCWVGPVLGSVTDDLLGAPTPCGRWRLRDLLAHLDDALTAFTEAAAGEVRIDGAAPTPDARAGAADLVTHLRARASRLLGAWMATSPVGVPVRLADRGLDADLLVRVAALEVGVHGWDVARTVGGPALPTGLASALLPAARLLVPEAGRAGRFAAPVTVDPGAPADVALLAWLGREPSAQAARSRGPG